MRTAIDVINGRGTWAVDTGDNLPWLRRLPAGVVRTAITSPPYFGLRDYGTGEWEGGDPECDHKPVMKPPVTLTLQGAKDNCNGALGPRRAGNGRHSRPSGLLQGGKDTVDAGTVARSSCPRCGAVRVNDHQIGLEETPDEYVDALVRVFRRVRRALTDDGTLWLNLGDSYASGGGGKQGGTSQRLGRSNVEEQRRGRVSDGIKPKDLIGIPWRVALALQADGWYLRSDIIWHAPNKMPESVTDRPTRAHEYLFLLSKSERYYYDADAIKERAVSTGGGASFGKQNHDTTGTGQQPRTYERPDYEYRNARSVWSIPTKSYHGAHFAVMPMALVIPCIRAGSAPGDVVMDPFTGSGTVLAAAVQERRRGIGAELNPAYADIARNRIAGATPALI